MSKPIFFLAFANDWGRFLPGLADEIRAIQSLLERPDSLCRPLVRSNARLEEIIEVFQHPDYKDRIALFQFSGHADEDGLILESRDGEAVNIEGLARFLGEQKNIPIVVLNACSSYRFVETLLDYNVPCVVATRRDIDDALAVRFAKVFYHSLAAGNPLQRAVDEAQAAVLAEAGETERAAWFFQTHPGRPDILDWNLPAAAHDPFFGMPALPDDIGFPSKPFRHLHWFAREHAHVFFGRGAEIRDLYNFVTTPGMPPLVLLYGQSGVGKSSLLAAGLLPRLEREWETVYLRRDAESGLLGTLRQNLPEVPNLREVNKLIVLDQVEEAYTRPGPDPAAELHEFFSALRDLFATPRKKLKLILGFRKEWLPEIRKTYLEAFGLSYKEVFLNPLRREGVIEAITGPVRAPRLHARYSLNIDDGLAERIALKLTQDPDAAIGPTLQILLDQLWTQATAENPAAPVFSAALYESLEKEGVYLRDFLDNTLDKRLARDFPNEYRSGLLLDLLYLHTTPLGTSAQRDAAYLRECYPHVSNLAGLVQGLKGCYLLSDPPGIAEGNASRLSHDTLAPLIRERFELSDKPGQRARRVLENRGVDWQDGKQGVVLDEADLKLVEQGREGMRNFSADEQRLFKASRVTRKRRERNRKLSWTGLATAMMITVSAVILWILKVEAEQQKLRNQSYSLAAQAAIELNKDKPATAMRLALEVLPNSSESHPKRPFVAPTYDFLFRAINRQYRGVLEHDGTANKAKFSPDGQYLLTSSGKLAYLWEVKTRQFLASLQGHKHLITSLAFSQDGRQILTTSWDKSARLWLEDKDWQVGKSQQYKEFVESSTVGADGSFVLTAPNDNMLRLWALESDKALAHLKASEADFKTAKLSPNGGYIVTVSRDNSMRLWANDGSLLLRFQDDEKHIRRIIFSPDSTRIMTLSQGDTIRLLTTNNGQELAHLEHGGFIHSAAVNANNTQIALSSNITQLWAIDKHQELARLQGHKQRITSTSFSPNGKYIATASQDHTARLWTTHNGKELGHLLKSEEVFRVISFSADNTLVSTIEFDSAEVCLWAVDTGTKLRCLTGHNNTVNSAAFNSDCTLIVTASDDHSARLWATDSGRELKRLQGHEDRLHSAVFSADDKYIVTASADKTARIWSSRDGQELKQLQGHEAGVRAAVFSPNDRLIATASDDKNVRFWSNSGVELKRLQGHEERVNSVAFSSDGQRIVTASEDTTVRVWQVNSGEEVLRMQGHEYGVTTATFSPDNTHIISVSEGGRSARLWDANSGEELARLQEQNENLEVIYATFSPNKKHIITTSTDGTTRIWLTFPTLEEMIAYAKKMLPPRDSDAPGDANIPGWRLTCAERKRFFLEEVERCKSVNN